MVGGDRHDGLLRRSVSEDDRGPDHRDLGDGDGHRVRLAADRGPRRSAHPNRREAILRVLEDCPEELAELRATLLQEHLWRVREGLV